MEIATVFLILLPCIFFLMYRHIIKHRATLEALGIPIDKPSLIFSSPPYAMHKTVMHDHVKEAHQRLGWTFGRYDGITPVVSTIDPEIVKAIMSEKFECFNAVVEDKEVKHINSLRRPQNI